MLQPDEKIFLDWKNARLEIAVRFSSFQANAPYPCRILA